MDQKQTPLLDAIENFRKEDPAFFRIPAHRFQRGVDARSLEVLGSRAFMSDLTEAEGMDDLHNPEGPIAEAQTLAAELYGSGRCWFLVNGTTGGNEAMVLAAVGPGEKILVPRNAHKSILMGLILSGAVPVWITPEYIEAWDIYGAVSPEKVRQALEQDPEIKAVFLVSPTYYGICSDLSRISSICHAHGIPLLIDEAHGSHMHFSQKLPDDAIYSGADLVAQSTHKTCGSMTQSSMLHWNSSLISEERVDACLKLVMSTSPNYLLMGSLDGARHMLAQNGAEMVDRAIAMADIAREEIGILPGFRAMHIPGSDLSRLVISAADAGISGYRLHELLFQVGRVSCELSDPKNVVAVISWGNNGDDIRRLVEACRTISAQGKQSDVSGISSKSSSEEDPEDTCRKKDPDVNLSDEIPEIPPCICSPRDAFYKKTKRVSFSDAVNQIAGESIIPYPPGIPLIYPGEILTREIYDAAVRAVAQGNALHGVEDQTLQSFRIIENEPDV